MLVPRCAYLLVFGCVALFGCRQTTPVRTEVHGISDSSDAVLSELAIRVVSNRTQSFSRRNALGISVAVSGVVRTEDGWLVEVRYLPDSPGSYSLVEFDGSMNVVEVHPGR